MTFMRQQYELYVTEIYVENTCLERFQRAVRERKSGIHKER